MKLIKQSFEFINQTDFSLVGIKKHIERCARVSYKSEDKITDTSYEKFVNMLESRGHDRPLEFGTVYLDIPTKNIERGAECKYSLNPWSIKEEVKDHAYISTNYRVIKDNHWEDDLQYLCEPTEYHHKRYTVHMILDRGVMDEFRTHVGLSHLAESTRYCNYSKDKFNNEIAFIIPDWVDSIKEGTYTKDYEFPPMWGHDNWMDSEWFYAMCEAEKTYLTMTREYLTPQQAREVLPLSVKSELISCGFKEAWENFFYRRDAPDAHPMAQEIAKPMHKEFIERGFIDK